MIKLLQVQFWYSSSVSTLPGDDVFPQWLFDMKITYYTNYTVYKKND